MEFKSPKKYLNVWKLNYWEFNYQRFKQIDLTSGDGYSRHLILVCSQPFKMPILFWAFLVRYFCLIVMVWALSLCTVVPFKLLCCFNCIFCSGGKLWWHFFDSFQKCLDARPNLHAAAAHQRGSQSASGADGVERRSIGATLKSMFQFTSGGRAGGHPWQGIKTRLRLNCLWICRLALARLL